MSKKFLCSLLLLLCCLPLAFAQQKQKFTIDSFERAPLDISARETQYEKRDGSGARYAIIKVTATNPEDDLSAYRFNFGLLKSIVEERDGVLWVYVQRNAKKVTITRDGYIPVREYDLQTTIEEGANYRMIISTEAKKVYSQMVQFTVTPANAKAVVTVQSKKKGAQKVILNVDPTTGSVAQAFEYGSYTYEVIANNYYMSEGHFTLNNKNVTQEEIIDLKANFGNITLVARSDEEIWVNGERKGIGRWSGMLKSDSYSVECRAKNHKPSLQYVTVTDGKDETVNLQHSTPIVGSISITSTPLGANISIDGKDYGKTPKMVDMIIGNHNVVVSQADYKSVTHNIRVEEGQTAQVNVVLERTGKITINSKPEKAELYIDGKHMGQTPYTSEMASGDYTVKLTYNQYQTFEKKVHLDISKPNVRYSLKRQMQKKSALYFEPFVQAGSSLAAGGNIGGYIGGFNVELSYTYKFGKADLYFNQADYAPDQFEASAYSIGARLGYGIIANSRLRITPQVGVQRVAVECDLVNGYNGSSFTSGNYSVTLGARLEYAITSHMGISFTPEGLISVSKDEDGKNISEVSSKIKNMLTGIYAKIGIYFNI